jgi:glucose-6-phosphate 1-dehydrogenase
MAEPPPSPAKHNSLKGVKLLQHAALNFFVIGASGDLAKKKTYPSLFALYIDNYLPKHCGIWGYARSSKSDEDFRAHLKPFLAKVKGGSEELVDAFLARCFYRSGQYDSADSLNTCVKEAAELEPSYDVENRIFYLAIPPSVFAASCTAIKAGGGATTSVSPTGWTRIVVEKPFGHDSDSCAQLMHALAAEFTEDYLYRIDHYLGKEMVQNLTVMRFANTWFEALWNRNYISNIQITFKEDIGTGGRGGYFDTNGIIRDVMQNHLLQVLSVIAMEPPIQVVGDDGNYLRDEKVKVLRAMTPIVLEDVVLGQYIGNDEGTEEGYLDDATVPEGSNCATFCTAVMFVNNARWAGVPFIMKAGKALNERKAEVRRIEMMRLYA